MKIGIEAERANLLNPTGVEKYATELIKNLARLDQKNQYVLYFRTQPQTWFLDLPKNFTIKIIPFPKFWTQTRLALEVLLHPVDVFFLPIQALPFIHPKNSVITVHDIAYEFFPQAFSRFMLFYLKLTTQWGVRMAKKIISVSQSTKNDIVKKYGIDAEKVRPVHLGFDANSYKPLPYEQVQSVLDKHGLTYKKYILFLGTLQPRKNIINLIDAYLKLRKDNHIEEKLVIGGGKGWLYDSILKKINDSKSDGVVYLEYIDKQELPALYAGATVLTLPAIYEGFGLPPLEAMACGTPVVVSNISSLPEVVGEAGKLVDPNSIDSIAQGIKDVLTDPNLQKKMSEAGLLRAKEFSWEKCAKQILEVFESLKV